ncbi:MAG TPA: hypothetical protein VFS92_03200 [Planctomycetota bacterium]|nr:hypothetical protein [Planctomycetota bacterium]
MARASSCLRGSARPRRASKSRGAAATRAFGALSRRRVDSKRFTAVQAFTPRCVMHTFTLRDESDLDEEMRGFLAEAAAVGRQERLYAPGPGAPGPADDGTDLAAVRFPRRSPGFGSGR